MKEHLIKALKEGGRVVVLAVLPVILIGINTQDGTFTINWAVVLTTGFVAILRALDKFLHEGGVEKGLTGF